MLSCILNSGRAIKVNLQIIRFFTRITQMLSDNTELRLEIEKIKNKLENHGKNIEIVFRYLDELTEKKGKFETTQADRLQNPGEKEILIRDRPYILIVP